jgi:hypothetical protein
MSLKTDAWFQPPLRARAIYGPRPSGPRSWAPEASRGQGIGPEDCPPGAGGSSPSLRWRSEINQAIDASRWLLDLPDDYDGDGSLSYAHATWNRAATFLSEFRLKGLSMGMEYVPSPSLRPGPDGAIDVHWETESFELLLKIPPGEDSTVSFYGDDYERDKIKRTRVSLESATEALLKWIRDLGTTD